MNKNLKDDLSQDDTKKSLENQNTLDSNSKLQEDTPNTDTNPKKEKSLFEMAKEIEEKEHQRELELERQAQEQYEKERENYAKKLQQDKIELIKLKQGAIDHSDTIHEIHEEAPVLTFPQKISNFFYHNIWWLWIVAFMVIVASFIIHEMVTTPKADATVLMLITNDELSYYTEQIGDYFEQFIEDNTGDGVSTVNIYYIPINISENDKLFTSYMAKYSGEMQSANSLLVIADDDCKERLFPDDILYDLSDDFGQYDSVEDYKYYLKDTSFQETIGYNGTIGDDVYIGIRKVQKVFDSAEKMQENFDIAYELINNLISYEEEGVMNIG